MHIVSSSCTFSSFPPHSPPNLFSISFSSLYLRRLYLLLLLLPSPATLAAVSPLKGPVALVPNAKNVKQMLLDWCRAKTEPYEVSVCRLFLAELVSYCPARALCLRTHVHTDTQTHPDPLYSACRGWTYTTSPLAGRTASPSAP